MEKVIKMWKSFGKELDKHPQAFQLRFVENKGYVLEIDVDKIKI